LLLEPYVHSTTVAGVAAAGWNTLGTVPLGKRWTPLSIHVDRSAGDGTFIAFAGRVAGTRFYFVDNFTATSDKSVIPAQQFLLKEYHFIEMYVNAVTVASTFNVLIYVLEEDVKQR